MWRERDSVLGWWRAVLVSALLALGGLSFSSPVALAAGQRGHVFSFAFGGRGDGAGELSDPTGVAVDDVTGDVYVADRKNERVDRFTPVVREGELVGEEAAGSFAASSPWGVAVDDSTEGSDPSGGDVYVVCGGKTIEKFSPEGVAVGEIKTFEIGGVKHRFAAIEGVAVDSAGTLFVYQEGGVIDTFNDAVANEGQSSLQVDAGQSAERGFALDSSDDFYVGVEGAGGVPVVARLEGITGNALIPELDGEKTTAVAVNTMDDSEATGLDELDDVYAVNVAGSGREAVSTVAQFALAQGAGGSEEARLVGRFGAPGLTDGDGIAVDARGGGVFVADAATDVVDVFELELPGPPVVEGLAAVSATPPAADARRLAAQVNPMGADTRYFFEYGTEGCAAVPSPCTRVPAVAQGLGSGVGDREASVELTGLPSGVYRFRAVAENALGTVHSTEGTFTILTAASRLPDGRAWEMVSPPDMDGAPIEALTWGGGLILAAEDGDALAYVANGAIEEEVQGNRSFEPQQVLAVRGLESWSSRDIATPQDSAAGSNFGAPEYQFFSPDLSLALVEPFVPEPPLAPGVTGKMVYLRADQPIAPEAAEAQSYSEAQALVERGSLAPGFLPLVSGAQFLDATADLRHVVLEGDGALTGPSSGAGLYEWSVGGGLQFVSELPEGGGPAPAVALGYHHVRAHAISNDGSRVIWTSSQESPAHLYMRDLETETTIQLDAAQGVGEPASAGARFQTASADGSRVFFTDDQALVPGASGSVEPASDVTDLYVCEMVQTAGGLACALQDLTIPLHAGEHAAVQGAVLGASEDGSSVFLIAQGLLAENENANGETAQPGQENLYELRREGGEWKRTFIAVLSGEDSPDWDEGANVSDQNTAFQTARVSPNGEYLAFMSQRPLTGYDNEDLSSVHPGERLDEEVYLYDAHTGSLTCVSCDPTGARPVGVPDQERSGEGIGLLVDRRESWRGHWLAGSIPGWTSESLTGALYQSRYLNNEGRLFFDSADSLVPGIATPTREEQVAGKSQAVGVENVYEYEPAGVGDCTGDATGGCVALISSGSSDKESAFLEATPSGNDVFFLTAAQLSPQDTDDAFDIYDARVCTSESPCLAPPEGSRAQCSTVEECHLASSTGQAPLGASGTATFSGAGDLAPPPAKQEAKGVKATVKPLTRAQKLTKALAACRGQHAHSKKKRLACEARARSLYGPTKKKAGNK